MSDSTSGPSAIGPADSAQKQTSSDRFWRSLEVIALLILPIQSVHFAMTYSIIGFYLVILDFVFCFCLVLRLFFKFSFKQNHRLRWLLELLLFCVGFFLAFLARESVFEPTRTLYFNIKRDQLDQFAEKIKGNARTLDLVEIPRQLAVPKEYRDLVPSATGVRFTDGTVLIEVWSGHIYFNYMGFIYFDGDEAKVIEYLKKYHGWIYLQRMNDHWYKTAHGLMTDEMLDRLPGNQR